MLRWWLLTGGIGALIDFRLGGVRVCRGCHVGVNRTFFGQWRYQLAVFSFLSRATFSRCNTPTDVVVLVCIVHACERNTKMCNVFLTKHLFKVTSLGSESSLIRFLILSWGTHFLTSYWLIAPINAKISRNGSPEEWGVSINGSRGKLSICASINLKSPVFFSWADFSVKSLVLQRSVK